MGSARRIAMGRNTRPNGDAAGVARRGRRFRFIGPLLVLCGCHIGAGDEPKPVPECQAYEKALAACTKRNVPVASQPAALASTEEQRQRLKKLCAANLQLLNESCR